MGDKATAGSGEPSGNNNKTNTGASTKGGSSTSTNTGAGTRTGTGAGTGTGTKGNEKEKIVPRLVNVDVPESEEAKKERKRLERNAKRRERYAKEKATKTKEEQQLVNDSQLKILIMTFGEILASRDGMSQWRITEAEATQIATPLSNIIKNSTGGEAVEKYADHIALVMACISVVVPRIVITLNNKKKEKASNGVIKNRPSTSRGNNKAGTVNNVNRTNNGQTASNGKDDDTELLGNLDYIGG